MTQPSYGPLTQWGGRKIRLSEWGVETDISVLLLSTTTDPGNTGAARTTLLRMGLVLAKFTAGGNLGKWTNYLNAGANGQDVAAGILMQDVDMLALGSAVAQDTGAVVAQVGEFDGNKLIFDAAGGAQAAALVDFVTTAPHLIIRF